MIIEKINGIEWYTREPENNIYDVFVKKLKDLKLYSRLNKIKKAKNFGATIELEKPLAYWGDSLTIEFSDKTLSYNCLIPYYENGKPTKREIENANWAVRFFLYELLEKYDYKRIDTYVIE